MGHFAIARKDCQHLVEAFWTRPLSLAAKPGPNHLPARATATHHLYGLGKRHRLPACDRGLLLVARKAGLLVGGE
jgi:hypothetical protein